MAARPEPIVSAASIAGAVTTVATVLGFLGYAAASDAISGEAQAIGATAFGAVTIIGHLWAAFHARSKVTPLAHPVADDGTPLGKVTELHETAPAAPSNGAHSADPGVTRTEPVVHAQAPATGVVAGDTLTGE